MSNPPDSHHEDEAVPRSPKPGDAGSIEDVIPGPLDVDERDDPGPETPPVIPLGEPGGAEASMGTDRIDDRSNEARFDGESSESVSQGVSFDPEESLANDDANPTASDAGATYLGEVSESSTNRLSQVSDPPASPDPGTTEKTFAETIDNVTRHEAGPGTDSETEIDDRESSLTESSASNENEPDQSAQRPIGARLGSAASRLGLGKLLETSEQHGRDRAEHHSTAHAEPTDPNSRAGLAAGLVRAREGFRGFLDPDLEMVDLLPHRRFIGIAAALALLFLLADGAGLALITLSLVIPILIVMTIVQRDVFEKESNLMVAAVALAGGIAGLIITGFAAWLQNDQWFSNDDVRFGAAGFGGHFADRAGSAPFVVWFLNGMVVPALTVVAIAGIPIALRRWPQFRNEVMDGVILAGTAAAGFAVASNIVYWWPMISHAGPQGPVDEWTMRVIGVVILRSMLIVWAGAMIGAGVWRSMMRQASRMHTLPAIAGILGIVLLMFGSIQLQTGSPWAEFLWTAILAGAAYLLFQHALDQAVETDRLALGANQERVVCPGCHRVTPSGAFCSYCGESLQETSTNGPSPETAST